jgi:carboxynorspermidine decarboxylase
MHASQVRNDCAPVHPCVSARPMAHAADIPLHVFDQVPPRFDPALVQTPAFVVDLGLLRANGELLARVQRESGANILLAQKGFSMWSVYPLLRKYLRGCCASGLHEALLAHEEFGGEVHVYAPFFKPEEMEQILPIAGHMSFNSLAQFHKWKPLIDARRAGSLPAPSPGIRVNPEHSEVDVAMYDPCSPGCRLGIRAEALEGQDLDGIDGLHFHALCEQDSDVLERTLAAVEQRFPRLLQQVQWVNMGGGHHITRKDYDVDRLIRVVREFKQRWGKEVYLEPGEAVALNTGYLIASVQDMVGQRPSFAKAASAPSVAHGHSSSHPFRYRTQADANRAGAALCERLEAALGSLNGADAAERLHTEAQSLLSWAQESGWLVSAQALTEKFGEFEQLGGASEHDVVLDRPAGRVIKLTRPPNFGARGETVAYLENVLACYHLLGLDWRFEGIVQADDGLRVITSQSFVEGEGATTAQIKAYMAALGFQQVKPHTFQRATDGIMIADARSDNVLCDAAGNLVLIDVHVLNVHLPDLALDPAPAAEVLPTAILDISATAHMPDTLEMPYRPLIQGAGWPQDHAHLYRLGGPTCLAGDVIGDYSFPAPLKIGQRLVFADMAHYTMVKTTTFNGVPHPDIVTFEPETGELRVIRRFGYEDFKRKLS